MPRGPRDDAPGVVHHLMVRGIERRSIFSDDADREELLRRLSHLILELGFRCFAWALLPNHFHLVVRSGSVRVSRLMARLGTGYARYFNERHGRVGHLFQNRFRSRRVIDDDDLTGLVLYVCRNPLEAGLAGPVQLEEFRWCSVSALLGRRAPFPFEDVSETLALFDADPALARERLRGWLGVSITAAPPLRAPDSRDPAPRVGRPGRTALAALIANVCDASSIADEELRSRRRSRRIARARAVLVLRASRELGLSGSEIARSIGVTPSAVSHILDRARGEPARTSQVLKERPR
jgi:REP element-mobilizing transposase RayT/DNA-binding transcriptional ArsR family regulator